MKRVIDSTGRLRRVSTLLPLAAVVLFTTASAAHAQWVYWTIKYTSVIQRAHVDGSDLQNLETGDQGDIRRFALDADLDLMYWGDQRNGIRRSDLNGRNTIDLIDTESKGIALDKEHGKIYWCGGGLIHRADLDGSNSELVLDAPGSTEGLALDVHRGYVYWTDWTNGYIRRWQLDSPLHPEILIETEPAGPEGIALDIARGKMYWADEGSIRRANLDGTAAETLVPDTFANGIALDLDSGKMYWTIEGAVERANLDGSDVEAILNGLGYANDIALDLRPDVFTSFMYQGQLKQGGRVVDAPCDFEFRLWNAPVEGSAIGSPIRFSGLSVESGLFSVELDFGSAAFDGTKRWLELAVRCPDGPHDPTTLDPRQPITAAPYAQYALNSPAFYPASSTASAALSADPDVERVREEVDELTDRLSRLEDLVRERTGERQNATPR